MTRSRMVAADRTRCAGGFTLLEVIVALLLVGALVMLLWSMLDTHFRFFEAGGRRTERAQLARSALSRLADDLACCIPVYRPAPGSAPSNRTDVRATGELIGDRTALRFLVLRSKPVRYDADFEQRDAAGEMHGEFVEELMTVAYEMQGDVDRIANGDLDSERNATASDLSFGLPGTLRAERRSEPRFVRTEAPFRDNAAAPRPRAFHPRSHIEFRAGGGDIGSPAEPTVSASLPAAAATASSESEDIGPRISALEFRYFDGERWHDRWSTRSRGELPRAIEVTLTIAEREIAAAAAPTSAGEGAAESARSVGQTTGDEVVRRLLFLDGSDMSSNSAKSPSTHESSWDGVDDR